MCGTTGMNVRYSNRSEPAPRETCGVCKEVIPYGEVFVHVNGDVICENCIADMSVNELVKACGGTWRSQSEEGAVYVIR